MPVTAIQLRAAKPKERPYRITDGRGLYVEVVPTGAKYWRLKYRYGGKEKRLAMGVYPDVGIKAARASADQARRHLAGGTDPGLIMRQAKRERLISLENTFQSIARDNRKDLWDPEHAQRIPYRRGFLFLRRQEAVAVLIIGPEVCEKMLKGIRTRGVNPR